MTRDTWSSKLEAWRPAASLECSHEPATWSIVDPVLTICSWKTLRFVHSFTVLHKTNLRRETPGASSCSLYIVERCIARRGEVERTPIGRSGDCQLVLGRLATSSQDLTGTPDSSPSMRSKLDAFPPAVVASSRDKTGVVTVPSTTFSRCLWNLGGRSAHNVRL